MDLAVGMIVGSAFTAVITALVKNILTPLINAIPGTNETGALQTVLREAVTDSNGNVVTGVVSGTLTIQLYLFMQKANYDEAFATAVVLLVVVLGINGLAKFLSHKFNVETKV